MIIFTKHAEEKFKILARHGVSLTRDLVLQTLETPDVIDRSRAPLLIAQCSLDKDHVLRVVFKRDTTHIIVITFYPGRKSQYGRTN